ncbi:MAG: MFS transporter, partial [Lentihominibacter sp.]
NIFREYISVARLRPMKYLIAASLFSLIVYTMLMSNVLYYFTFNLKLSAVQISACLMIRSLLGIAFIPLVGKLSVIFDKRIALIGCYLLGITGMLLIRLIGLEALSGAVIYTIFLTICTAIYWQLMPSIFYDICEYDKVTTGKKREAMILSFQGLVEAVAVGIGGQILGAILQMAGFNGSGTTQTIQAMTWIENSATILPMIFLAISSVALYKYPLRRDTNQIIK